MANGSPCCISTGRSWPGCRWASLCCLKLTRFFDRRSHPLCFPARNYNRNCVKPSLVFRPLMAMLAIGAALLSPAQQTAATDPQAESHGHLILVLPFENRSGDSNIDWMSESMPEIINRRLESAGFLPIGREDRLYALGPSWPAARLPPVASKHHPSGAES